MNKKWKEINRLINVYTITYKQVLSSVQYLISYAYWLKYCSIDYHIWTYIVAMLVQNLLIVLFLLVVAL
jgi:hypothetical protein